MSTASTWIYETITGDSGLGALVDERVFKYVAPEGTELPFIVIQEVASPPVENATADRIGDREDWIIKVYDKGESDINADSIDRSIRTLLHKASAPGIIHCLAGMRRTQADKDRNGNPIRGIVRSYEIFTQE